MELLKIETKENISGVSAKGLFKELGMNTSQWVRYYENNITKNNFFIENVDYCTFDTMSRGNVSKDFMINIEMAKHLCMLAKTEKAHEIREYFLECEKQLLKPKSTLELLEMAVTEIKLKDKQIEELKPKAEFFDAVADSKNAIEIGDVAKVIGKIGRNKLFEFLRNEKMLNDRNVPFQKYVDMGLFRVVEQKFNKPDGSVNISIKTLVYQKGVEYINKKLEEYNGSKIK